jgi:hypothetical protein
MEDSTEPELAERVRDYNWSSDRDYQIAVQMAKSERQAAVREFAEKLKQFNGSKIHDCGRRMDGLILPEAIDAALAEQSRDGK